MRKLSLITIGCLMLLLAGCEGDYDFKKNSYKKKVVVMSIINPDSLMQVRVYWNKPTGGTGGFEMIEGAHVEINEEGSVVFSGLTDPDGIAVSTVYPSAGKKYNLLVRVGGWPDLTASTWIPQPAAITYATRVKTGGWAEYILADVSEITAPEEVNAVWLSTNKEYEDGSRQSWHSDMYSMCAFLDQVNATTEPDDFALRESNVVYESGFIRIQRSSLRLVVPFTFSFAANLVLSEWDWDEDNPEAGPVVTETYLDKAIVQIISPSADYDKFRRSQFRQWEEGRGDPWPFLTESIHVYSNIENGVGIFAGYNLTEFKQDIENPAKP